jgi:hypothetical protein
MPKRRHPKTARVAGDSSMPMCYAKSRLPLLPHALAGGLRHPAPTQTALHRLTARICRRRQNARQSESAFGAAAAVVVLRRRLDRRERNIRVTAADANCKEADVLCGRSHTVCGLTDGRTNGWLASSRFVLRPRIVLREFLWSSYAAHMLFYLFFDKRVQQAHVAWSCYRARRFKGHRESNEKCRTGPAS